MKRLLPTCLLLGALTTFQKNAHAQNWQLVWQDEFTNGISADWNFETGNGGGGWGNNELEYYRRENATVENGQLVITAKRESFGGFNYTSARMTTQGKKSWKFGKIEARIKMPAFSGIWPAFWMLGDNISTGAGWPACGEIDIMEHINAENRNYGTAHWSDNNNQHASYGNNIAVTVTDYHIYSIEWDTNYIRWFVDGTKFHEIFIGGGINGTGEFQLNQFILLNMAVGGNWPGFNIDLNGFPAKMYVDYVKVYQDAGGNPPNNPGPATTIQAESYSNMLGVQTEATTDAGGGQDVGWIDAGDWMAYSPLVFPTSGNYLIEYRVASLNGGGRLSADLNAGSIVLGQLDVPNTGGWQNWTTISHTVYINAGTYTPGIYAVAGGWNLNWIRITPLNGTRQTVAVKSLVENSVQSGKAFTIYPNPVQQTLNITSGESLSGGLVRIFDLSGKQVMTARPATNHINVSALAPGVYTLVFTKDKTRITKEFVK